MKYFGKAVLLIAGLVVLPAVLAAQSEKPMRVEVPFAFMAGDHMYAAGSYVVTANTDFGYMDLRESRSATSERIGLARIRVARKGVNREVGFLQFEQLGATYALTSVCAPHAVEGVKVKPAKAQLEMAKRGGGATGKIVTITQ